MTEYQKHVQNAVTNMHGDCVFMSTESVTEKMGDQLVWEGDVEIFKLIKNDDADLVYGWGYQDDGGKWNYVGILGIHPVSGAKEAVRVAIASGQIS